jgi:VWFA-related protein
MVSAAMRFAYSTSFLLLLTPAESRAQQQPDPKQTVLKVESDVVLVPALVRTKQGAVVFNLTAADFSLRDNGIPQKLTLDTDTDTEPLALAICVETGGSGAMHIKDYPHLEAFLDALIAGVQHRVAVIAFDSTPHLLLPFTPEIPKASHELANLKKGDPGAAILDAVTFAVQQLKTQPPAFRRAILLFSETIDQGSATSLGEALRLTSDANTVLYAFGFSSTKANIARHAPGIQIFEYSHPNEPGPPHGCFSREGADAEYDGHYSRQVFDCLALLAPPLRIAQMAYLTARNGLRTNTAASLAQLTGGEFFHYSDAKGIREGLTALSHDMLQYYVLSFRPTPPTPGPHALRLEVKTNPQLTLKSRTGYWIDENVQQD